MKLILYSIIQEVRKSKRAFPFTGKALILCAAFCLCADCGQAVLKQPAEKSAASALAVVLTLP